jgi:phage shock protein A
MHRPRAADDFDTIRQRLEELRRERDAAETGIADAAASDGKTERRRRERLEGSPPPWAPTIFAKQPRR